MLLAYEWPLRAMSGPWLSERNESAPIVPTQRVPAHEVVHVCTSYRSGFMHRNGNAYGNVRYPFMLTAVADLMEPQIGAAKMRQAT